MQTKGLSSNALKVIAIIAMTIDHLAWVGIETYQQAETPMQIGLHCIGRLTAPMMIFFVAEGYYHTHDFRRYLRRLLMLAVVSHFAFCYFNMSGFNPLDNLLFNATSIAWPLLWGLILLKVWDMDKLARWHKVAVTLLTHAQIIVHEKNEEIPSQVAEGHADVMITEITEAPWYVQNDTRLAAPLLAAPFTHGEIGVLMRKGQDDLLALVNSVIAQMKADGTLRQLHEKYGLVYGY